MRETGVTWFLDIVRHLIKIAGTVTVTYLSWTVVHWLLAFVLAIPIYLAVSGFVDFLAVPLYLLTPESRSLSKVLYAIEEGDFSTALRVLKAHEKWHAAESQAGLNIATEEVGRMDNSFAHAVSAA
jgi:hypothetical protein